MGLFVSNDEEVPDFSEKFNTKLDPSEEQKFMDWASKNNKLKDLYDYDLRGAFKAGETSDARGHLSDKYKKPNHPTFSNESIYNGVEGMQGGKWVNNGNGWAFVASPTNVKMHGQKGLKEYFQRIEPDSPLIIPGPLPGRDRGGPGMTGPRG